VVRDTDSAYVRLARQGGQRNLLSMEPDDAGSKSASVAAAVRSNEAPNTKPEWFYDNAGYYNNTTAAGSQSQHSFEPEDRGPSLQ